MDLQPDQRPALWDDHVASYETVFEPLTSAFAAQAIDRLAIAVDDRVIDVGAGCGAATLMLAGRGARVLSVDASLRMARRTRERLGAATAPPRGTGVAVMDGTRLAVADASMDAALSVLGVVLFPDAAAGMAEIARVVRPGGRAAVVTWTEPERYELMAELLAAVRSVIPDFPPPSSPPAQLRYRDPAVFRDLLGQAGLLDIVIERVSAPLVAPSSQWLAQRIAFAPGMAAMVGALGPRRDDVLDAFVHRLEISRGSGELRLQAVASIGVGRVGPR
jgi:SAM-dependent methyltransferase